MTVYLSRIHLVMKRKFYKKVLSISRIFANASFDLYMLDSLINIVWIKLYFGTLLQVIYFKTNPIIKYFNKFPPQSAITKFFIKSNQIYVPQDHLISIQTLQDILEICHCGKVTKIP